MKDIRIDRVIKTTPQKTKDHRPTFFISMRKKAQMAAARPTQDTMTLPRSALLSRATVKKSGKFVSVLHN